MKFSAVTGSIPGNGSRNTPYGRVEDAMQDARDLAGETVIVRLEDVSGIEFAGIEGDGPFFCRVTAVDEIGLWVRNTEFVTVDLTDRAGRSIPEKKRRERRHRVDILLPWRKIVTVIRFEGEDAGDLDPEAMGRGEGGRIGFVR